MSQDNVPSNDTCPRCSNPTRVHVTVPTGHGRVFCVCGWDDSNRRTPPVGSNPQNRHGAGVTIVGVNERQGTHGVEILGGH